MFLRPLLFLAVLTATTCLGQQHRSAIFIGNSYTYSNDMPSLIQQIAQSKGNTFSSQQNTPGGHTLNGHAQNPASLNLVENAAYDYMILQGQSAELAITPSSENQHRASNFAAAEHLQHLSKLKDTCHQALLFMTWGYNDSPQEYLDMQSDVSANYEEMGRVINSGVAPVGEAWRHVIENYPSIPLHSQDLSHPNLAGSYLAACVFYACMYQESPEGAWNPTGISASDALTLQQTAQTIVTSEPERWNLQPFSTSCASAGYPHKNDLWEPVNFPDSLHIINIDFPDDQTGYVHCEFPFSLVKTHDEGASWSDVQVPNNGSRSFTTHFITDSIGFFATADHAIDSNSIDSTGWRGPKADQILFPRVFKTTDAGLSWTELPIDSEQVAVHYNGSLNGDIMNNLYLHFDDEQRGTLIYSQIIKQKDTLFAITTNDGGQSWSFATNKLDWVNPIVQLRSADTIYAASRLNSFQIMGNKMAWWRSIDGGMSWQEADSIALGCCSTYATQVVQVMYPGKEGMLAANDLYSPYLVQFQDDALGWDTLGQASFMAELVDVEEVGSETILGLFENAYNHRIGISNDGGQSWELDSYYDDRLLDFARTSEYVYVGLREGVMLRRKFESETLPPPPPPPVVGMEDLNLDASVQVFPNPAEDQLFVQLSPAHQGASVTFSIFDVAGKRLHETKVSAEVTSISIDQLSPGMYFYRASGPVNTSGRFLVR